ncbi:outer membrane beta-barrel protein [Novosphingobium colocasiae]|uniref:outer membrane beta-barrel protein n=1 Tax=Novosphingobium colocasiae TaxID=1256513 RepID=UPI0035B012B6
MRFLKYGFAVAALCAQPAMADDFKSAGFRLEARIGWETPTVSDGDVYKIGQSVSFGGEAGYDVPLSNKVVVGPFVNYEYADSKTCEGGVCLGSDGNLAAGGRIGVNLGARTQLYGKVAYDSFRLKASIGGDSGTKTLTGVQGAIGIDYALSKSTYIGFEADYADLGSYAGVNFQRRHVALTGGVRF